MAIDAKEAGIITAKLDLTREAVQSIWRGIALIARL